MEKQDWFCLFMVLHFPLLCLKIAADTIQGLSISKTYKELSYFLTDIYTQNDPNKCMFITYNCIVKRFKYIQIFF